MLFTRSFEQEPTFLLLCAQMSRYNNKVNAKLRRKATNLSEIKLLTKQQNCR